MRPLLPRKQRNIYLKMESSEWIPYFAFLMHRTFDLPIKLPLSWSTSTHLHSTFFSSHGKGGWAKSSVNAWLLVRYSLKKSHILHTKQKKIDTDACVTWKKIFTVNTCIEKYIWNEDWIRDLQSNSGVLSLHTQFPNPKGLKIAVDQVSAKPTVCQMNDRKTAIIGSFCEYFE